MIEREYLKFNTGINLGSNSDQLKTDNDGNIEAKIELALPNNIFKQKTGSKKVDSVQLQVSKMRLSLQNTPIIQLPIDDELSNKNSMKVSKCEMDVYPYCLIDQKTLAPQPGESTDALAFPYYKAHRLCYDFFIKLNEEDEPEFIESIECRVNSTRDEFPKENRFYSLLDKANLLKYQHHMMNLVLPQEKSLSSSFVDSGDTTMLFRTETITEMLQNGMENAITFASMEDEEHINVYLINTDEIDPTSLTPKPNTEITMKLVDYGCNACFWYW